MGFTPEQVDRMSAWEFAACCKGYNRANGVKEERQPGDIPDERLREMGIKGF